MLTRAQVNRLRRWARMRSLAFRTERARGLFVSSPDQILAWLKRYEPSLYQVLGDHGCPPRNLMPNDTIRLTRNLEGHDPQTGHRIVNVMVDVTFLAVAPFHFHVLPSVDAPPTVDETPQHQPKAN